MYLDRSKMLSFFFFSLSAILPGRVAAYLGLYQRLKTGKLKTFDPRGIFVFNPEISNRNMSFGVVGKSQQM